jgi:hypothetical protein
MRTTPSLTNDPRKKPRCRVAWHDICYWTCDSIRCHSSQFIIDLISDLIADDLIQLRFALSSLNNWSEIDGDFSYCDFYNFIVDYFEITPGPRAKARVEDLLRWWTL